MPTTLPPLEDPARVEVRDGSAHGGSRGTRQGGHVSHGGMGEDVGLEAIDAGLWHVDCGPLTRGRFLERHLRRDEAYGRLTRRR